jgi:hypothetical protein
LAVGALSLSKFEQIADNEDLIRRMRPMRVLAAAASTVLLIGAPAAAAEPAKDDDFEIPAELTDPAMGETLGKMLGALTKAMMDMPVGEMQAAAEGRAPTAADNARTVRDLAGRDPNFERKMEQQIAATMPRMRATMKAMAKSLPVMARGMEKVAEQMEGTIDRATANLPQPGYPKR